MSSNGNLPGNSASGAAQTPGQLNGIVVLDKPAGPSSAQCLGVFKRQGQHKIGHAGTLDPMASGVLPVLLGHATKLSGWLMRGGRKVYSGVIRLGIETDTWDMEGRVLAENPVDRVQQKAVEEAIGQWTQIAEQEAPAFSALKHNGQPLYKLARKGRETPVKIRKVSIFEAGMLDFNMPFVRFRVACGSGTYIRSLAHSLGKRLGCGAALAELTREYSHPFGLAQATSLNAIREGLRPCHVLPLTSALPAWPHVSLNADQSRDARNGRPIAAQAGAHGYAFLCEGDMPLAIARYDSGDRPQWVIERGLWDRA